MAERLPTTELEVRFNAIVEEYGKFLRSTIAQICPKDLGIQHSDIEQEAHLRLWRALESGREINYLASYIYKIAATATIDAVRRVKARREEQLRLDESEEEGANIPVAAPENSPDRIAARQQMIRKVRASFARIADNRRRAVTLHLEGLTTEEIAHSLGWSEPKARHLVYRGLKDLRQQLRAEGIDCEID